MRTLPFEYAVRNLGRSRVRLALTVLGSALVVLLVVAAAAFVGGMGRSLRATGGVDNVLLIGAGSEESVERSEIAAGVPGLLEASVPGIRTRAGVAYVSPEVHAMLPVGLEGEADARRHIVLRGITSAATLVHGSVVVLDGRLPNAGADEVMVGRMAAATLGTADASLATGRSLVINGRPWRIVGRFAAPGTVMESEVWAPLPDLKLVARRDSISCIVVTLDPSEAEFADIDAFTRMRPDLELSAVPEREYYARINEFFAPIKAVVWVTAGLIGLGGVLGGLNTMYAAFGSRVREIGTLRALGFRRAALVLSMVQECMLATAAGGMIGCGIGMAALDGVAVRFSAGAFGLMVDETAIAVGLGVSVLLGMVGSLPPAWRCLRLPIPAALKSA